MTALGIGVTDREAQTVFSGGSGRLTLYGQQKPAQLVRLQEDYLAAWEYFDEVCEIYGETAPVTMVAQRAAIQKQAEYFFARDLWDCNPAEYEAELDAADDQAMYADLRRGL